VHHNDSCLNVSTAFRIHILELFIITALKAAYIVTLGLDRATVLINETIITFFVNVSSHEYFLQRRAFAGTSAHRSMSCTGRTIQWSVMNTIVTTALSYLYGIAFWDAGRIGACENWYQRGLAADVY